MLKPRGTVGPYTLKSLLATGGQSQVWLAEGDEGEVALKVARTERHRSCIRREVEALSLGEHPGVPTLLDHDTEHNWLVQELIRGSTLDQWAQVHSFEDLAKAAEQLLDTLDHLHGHGVVHGDLKPGNILIDGRGKTTLCDFGIAGSPDEASEGFAGTLGFVPPEQLRGGKRALPGVDLYGLAALLYACVAGRPPFTAEDPAALTYLPMVTLPPPLSSLVPDVPDGLDDLLGRNENLAESLVEGEVLDVLGQELLRSVLVAGEGSDRVPFHLGRGHRGDSVAPTFASRLATRDAARARCCRRDPTGPPTGNRTRRG